MKDPLPAYKHMRREHADLMIAGKIRISPLRYYTEIEGAPTGIEDRTEGQEDAHISSMTPSGGSDQARDLERWGISIAPGSTPTLRNVQFTRTFDNILMYCLSSSNKLGLFDGYDTVIKISNYRDFAEIVRAAHPDLLGNYRVGPVQYDKETPDLAFRQNYQPDPFRKPLSFSWQQEIRVLWEAKKEVVGPIDLHIPELARMHKQYTGKS